MVGIQGTEGSFHYQAARLYFGNEIGIKEYRTFDAIAKSLVDNTIEWGVMAIENSIAGAILANYALIDRYNLSIVGELYMNIQHHLMALEGQSIEELKEVHSHYMALLQCKDFFEAYPHIKLVEATNTAQAAREIQEGQLKGVGAIASASASVLYGLPILAKSIQTIKQNATRFVILSRRSDFISKEERNKVTLKFQLYDQSGSLATVLNVLRDHQMNMTKIQSLPVIETPWKYAFFIEATFRQYNDYAQALQLLEVMTEDLKVLGEYQLMVNS